MHLLLLDNHDSFTWNLVELLRNTGKVNVNIVTPGQVNLEDIGRYDRILFSPGPGLPAEQPAMFRILEEVERLFSEGTRVIPVFGVCLGMQAIAEHYGGKLFNLPEVVHGQPRAMKILRPNHFLFRGIQDNADVGLYHSWAVKLSPLPSSLDLLAVSGDGNIMALAHKALPVCGVQFHPESVMTPSGALILRNWIGDLSHLA
ncbi:MAG TPA: aminodeoxychorismate/anthranilate synthase component II [Bacteroidales bacterium]|nr:aminodeoxychorismate/anthranilate synthase component II [Bacteroidales bacterium]